jgi:hypothetical protein
MLGICCSGLFNRVVVAQEQDAAQSVCTSLVLYLGVLLKANCFVPAGWMFVTADALAA